MAKFFRVIVNLCILCFLLTGLALLVPQFMNISTVIVDEDVTDTNLKLGTVVYGKTVSLSKLEIGDKILRVSDASVYASEITAADTTQGKYTVEGKDGASEEVTLRNTGEKVLIAVPLIGYVSIAMQTFEGRIILGLALAFVIILFILSEIWKRNDEDDEEEDDEEEVVLSKSERKALKKAEKRRRAEASEESAEAPAGADASASLSQQEESADAGEQQAEELILESVEYGENTEEPEVPSLDETQKDNQEDEDLAAAIQAALSREADQTAADNMTQPEPAAEQFEQVSEQTDVPEAEAQIEKPVEEILPEIDMSVVTELIGTAEAEKGYSVNLHSTEDEVPEEAEFEDSVEDEEMTEMPRQLAMPILTVDELLEKAHSEGDEPEIVEDKENGVTLLDYSGLL